MEFTGLDMRKIYQLKEPPIASGGEGSVHEIRGEPDKLAKVYHHPERMKPDKIRYMILEAQSDYGNFISRMISWPIDALVSEQGEIYGFIMMRFPGVTKLSEILPDQSIGWGKRVIIAWNLCDIVQDVEKLNQCIGDMNPSNFGVDLENGHVYAFDADSFHFRAPNGHLFPCQAGIAEYYAPELQRQLSYGQDLRTLDPEHTFTPETDRFALAVLIFQLLFNGYHPFSARRLENYGSSTVVHRQSTNILNKVCAYFNPQAGTGIPKDAPPIDIIPPKMQQMFKRAFLTEDRPRSTEWQGALTELSKSLKKCNNEHYYYSQLPECPWCKNNKSASPSPSSPLPSSKSSETKTPSSGSKTGTGATNTVSSGTRAGTGATNTVSSGTRAGTGATNTVSGKNQTVTRSAKTTETSNGGFRTILLIACIIFGIWFWNYYNDDPVKPETYISYHNPAGKRSTKDRVYEYHRYIHSGPFGKKELAEIIFFGFDDSYKVTWITKKIIKPYWMDISDESYDKMNEIYEDWSSKYYWMQDYKNNRFVTLKRSDDAIAVTFNRVNYLNRLSLLESSGFIESNLKYLTAFKFEDILEEAGYKEGNYYE